MSAAKPGWYPDPAADRDGPTPRYRWWDGSRWSDATATSAQAGEPGGAGAAAGPTDRPMDRSAARPSAGTAVPAAWTTRTRLDDGAEATAAARGPLGSASRWTLAVVLVTAVAIVVGLVVWRDPTVPDSDPADARGPDSPAETDSPARPVGKLDETTRRVTLGAATMTLPDDPYVIYGEPMRIPGLIDEFFQANAVIHPRYDWNRDWSAVVGLADVDTSRTDAVELDKAAASALRQFAQVFFGGNPTTVRKVRTADYAVDGRPGVRLTAEVHYRLPVLPSRFDRVTAVLVRQDDGSVVAAFSSIPNDCPPEFSILARESLASLEIS